MNYTPGPWYIYDEERELDRGFAEEPPLIVAPPSSTGYDVTEDIAEIFDDNEHYVANAYLIAASPAMYEALKELVPMAEELAARGRRPLKTVVKKAKALLAEIEGKVSVFEVRA